MKNSPSNSVASIASNRVLVAGQLVPAGVYSDIDTGKIIVLEEAGILPAACDGRVAVYVLRPLTYGELKNRRPEKAA